MFVTTIRAEYWAHDSGDAEHLAALMCSRLDDLTPHSTNVRIEDWPEGLRGHEAEQHAAQAASECEGHQQ